MSTQGITYELALALKNAGFSQKLTWYFINNQSKTELITENEWKAVESDYGNSDIDGSWERLGKITVPTLSELIEACEDSFISLNKSIDSWNVLALGIIANGETPEEAVAKLWLALNKSKEIEV